MKQKNNLKNIDKKIKRVEVLSKIFDGLGKNISVIKSLAASIISVIMLGLGSSVNYYVCVILCGLLWSDFLAESVTCYGENVCDKIFFSLCDKLDDLKKEKNDTCNNVFAVKGEDIEKAKNELGILTNNNVLILDSKPKNNTFEDEKIC